MVERVGDQVPVVARLGEQQQVLQLQDQRPCTAPSKVLMLGSHLKAADDQFVVVARLREQQQVLKHILPQLNCL